MALAVEEILHLSTSLSGAGAAELFVAFRRGFHLQGYYFFFSHLFNYLFFVHLTTQSHVHHFTQVAVIVEVLEKPLRLHPPGEAAKGPLCLGTSFVPNAARQIYLFKIRPLSTAAAAA